MESEWLGRLFIQDLREEKVSATGGGRYREESIPGGAVCFLVCLLYSSCFVGAGIELGSSLGLG